MKLLIEMLPGFDFEKWSAVRKAAVVSAGRIEGGALLIEMENIPVGTDTAGLSADIAAFLDISEVILKSVPASEPGDWESERNKRIAQARRQAPPKPQSDLLYGKGFKPKTIIPMKELSEPATKICVCGTVFKMDERKTKTGRVYGFYMNDDGGAVRVSRFFRQDEKPPESIKPGMRVIVKGRLEVDRFKDNELVLYPESIIRAEKTERQDDSEHKRVELHMHTCMSQMDGLTNVKKLLNTAERWGHEAVAVTDHGVLHAFPDIMDAAANLKVKPIYGCEGYLHTGERSHHVVLLARNDIGMTNLYKLVSSSFLDTYRYHPNIPKEKLAAMREGLLIGSACERGELFCAITQGRPRSELLSIARFYDYLEIMPLCNNAFMLRGAEPIAKSEEQLRDWNRLILSLGDELEIPVAATSDAHFLEPEDEIYRRILLAAKKFSDCDEPLPLYYKTTEEMLSEFSYLGESEAYRVVVENTAKIASMCDRIKPVKDNYFPPKIENSATELREMTMRRAAELYGEQLPEIISERISLEINPIISKGYDVIYVIAQKLVQRSMENGYIVGSRGSVGSSIVAYFAGISEVNALAAHYLCPKCRYCEFPENTPTECGVDMPDKLCPICGESLSKEGFDIPFATFLGFEADKKPDIDLNFSGEYQAKAHEQCIEIFGEGKVFRCGTVGTIAEKTARAFAYKYVEERGLGSDDATLEWMANGIIGVKRSTGQHPGGMIVVPHDREITDFCPVQHPADKEESHIVTTHFDYHSIEENLLKLDILGHDDPSMLRMMSDITGIDPVRDIKLDNKATMSLFTTPQALGWAEDELLGTTGACAVPEFGTPFVREMLGVTKPVTMSELIKISGLSHGTNVWIGNSADIVKSGTATLKEIICTRDDITLYLMSMGLERKLAFTISESVRKGRGLKADWETVMRASKVPQWYIDSCNKIKYLFPKAHAAAYVIMAFRIAWFKVHYPLAFYAAYFSIRAGAVDISEMSAEMGAMRKRVEQLRKTPNATAKEEDLAVTLEVAYEFTKRGFEFLPISLYESDEKRFLPENGQLRPPLNAIPGLGGRAAGDIVAERSIRPFDSIEDIAMRCKGLNSTQLEQLRQAGALKDLPESTQLSLFG